MHIKDNTIHFKSMEEMYNKERDGRKSNTVRIVTMEESITISTIPFTRIQILKKDTDHYFTRVLTDISYLYDKEHDILIYVFSW